MHVLPTIVPPNALRPGSDAALRNERPLNLDSPASQRAVRHTQTACDSEDGTGRECCSLRDRPSRAVVRFGGIDAQWLTAKGAKRSLFRTRALGSVAGALWESLGEIYRRCAQLYTNISDLPPPSSPG